MLPFRGEDGLECAIPAADWSQDQGHPKIDNHLNTKLLNIRHILLMGHNISWLSTGVKVEQDIIPILRETCTDVMLK
jgi:hypothetical protein